MIALDVNVLIYFFEDNSEFGSDARKLLKFIESTSQAGCVSAIAYAELCAYGTLTRQEAAKAVYFLESLGLEIVELTKDVLLEAASLRRGHRLSLPDALYIATGLMSGATYFVTNDKQLLKKSVEGITIVPLTDWEKYLLNLV